MARPRSGEWLEDEIGNWQASGIALVVSLLEKEEVSDLGLQGERALCEQHGIDFLPFPIADRGVPAFMQETKAFAAMLLGHIADGRAVAIHCRAGIGRSSIVAGSVLVLEGMSATDALTAIATVRRTPVPDTDAQRLWLADFEAMVAGG
jgi:protein-tyrosine phosphatase